MDRHALLSFSGCLVAGRGKAAAFTRLEWVRDRLVAAFGIDPFPGTLNLVVNEETDRRVWSTLRSTAGTPIDPGDDRWCTARGYAVRVNGWLPAAVVLPDVPGYPPWQVEIVAALKVREALSLVDGSRVAVEERTPLRVRAVIFDVDGTLVDSLAAYRIVAEQAAAPYGVPITDAVVREALCTTRAFWDLALPPDQPDRSETIHALARDTARRWPEVLRAHGHVCPHARAVVEALRGRGVKLGIFTGSRRESLGVLAEAGLLDAFDAVVTAEDIARRKPDPEGLHACAARLGVPAGDAAYVGDTPLDAQAGRAAGMSTVAVLGGAGDSAALSAAGPDHLVGSLAGVPETIGPLHGS